MRWVREGRCPVWSAAFKATPDVCPHPVDGPYVLNSECARKPREQGNEKASAWAGSPHPRADLAECVCLALLLSSFDTVIPRAEPRHGD